MMQSLKLAIFCHSFSNIIIKTSLQQVDIVQVGINENYDESLGFLGIKYDGGVKKKVGNGKLSDNSQFETLLRTSCVSQGF